MSPWWYLLIDLFPLSLILVVAVQLLSHVWLFAAPRTAACRALLSTAISGNLLKFISIESVMLSNISSFIVHFSFFLQSFPASRSFPMSQHFLSGGQSIGVSASVLPMKIQGWFPLRLVWSPCSPRDSQESSLAPQFESISSSALSLLYSSTLTSIHDYWKNYSFDYADLCQQSDVSAF